MNVASAHPIPQCICFHIKASLCNDYQSQINVYLMRSFSAELPLYA
uniref:Uncharacterized protein n=1 Tax=Anguilla anguilla TaxID=7936 RepID=A0A0E9TSV0_ANGAN